MNFFNPKVGDFIYIHVGQVLLLYAAMLAKPWRAVPAEIYPTDTDRMNHVQQAELEALRERFPESAVDRDHGLMESPEGAAAEVSPSGTPSSAIQIMHKEFHTRGAPASQSEMLNFVKTQALDSGCPLFRPYIYKRPGIFARQLQDGESGIIRANDPPHPLEPVAFAFESPDNMQTQSPQTEHPADAELEAQIRANLNKLHKVNEMICNTPLKDRKRLGLSSAFQLTRKYEAAHILLKNQLTRQQATRAKAEMGLGEGNGRITGISNGDYLGLVVSGQETGTPYGRLWRIEGAAFDKSSGAVTRYDKKCFKCKCIAKLCKCYMGPREFHDHGGCILSLRCSRHCVMLMCVQIFMIAYTAKGNGIRTGLSIKKQRQYFHQMRLKYCRSKQREIGAIGATISSEITQIRCP